MVAGINDFLFVEGKSAMQVISLKRGCVVLEKINQSGGLSFVGLLLPEDIYFERGEVHRWQARAIEGATYASEPKHSFQQRLSRDPDAAQTCMQGFERQLQRQRELMALCNHSLLISRFAGLLLWMMENMPHRSIQVPGVVGIKFPFRQVDVGVILNVGREAITKAFGILKKNGIVECQGKAAVLLIREEASLRRLVDSRNWASGY